MTAEADEPIRRRHLIVVATGHYDEQETWPDLDVESEVAVWSSWLTSERLAARRFMPTAVELAADPDPKDLDAFRYAAPTFIRPTDAAVLVMTGHGEVIDHRHRLVLKKADSKRPDSTMQLTSQIISSLRETGVQHAFVVVDTCHSGHVMQSVVDYDQEVPAGWIGIATAGSTGSARLGAASTALADFLAELSRTDKYGSELERYLNPQDVLSTIANACRLHLLFTFPANTPSPCLPNFKWTGRSSDAAEVSAPRQALALARTDLPTVGWAESDTTTQVWRPRLMAALVAATTQPFGGVWVLTGAAGCGKTAALSRLATLADPVFRAGHSTLIATIPPAQCPGNSSVDVALSLRGMTTLDVMKAWVTALRLDSSYGDEGTPASRLAVYRDILRRRFADGPTLTVLLDGLDQASNPAEMLENGLWPLCDDWSRPPIRLIVSLRGTDASPAQSPTSATAIAPDEISSRLCAVQLMADSGEFFDPAELVTYVKHLLTEETSSRNHESRGTPQRLVDIAEAIAAQSGPSFVAAGIAARSYAATGHNDSQLLPLDRGLAGLVESELNRVYPNRSRRRSAVAILAVAAAAFGPGMAWGDVWPAAAAAVVPSGASGLDDDIQELVHGDLGRWVQRTLNSDGSTVYRIADESLREAILRLDSFGAVVERPNETGYLTELHRAITRGLQPLLHRKTLMGESLPPPAYARRYIADHAAAGGILSLLLADAMSLPDVHPMIAERAKSLSPAQRTAPLHPDTVSQSPTANSNDHATDSAGESATRQLVSQGALERSAALRPAKSGSTPRLSGAKPSGLLIASAAIGTIAVSLVTGALLWRGNASGGDAPSTQVPSGSIPTVLVTTTVVQQADPTAVQQADPNTVTVQEIPPTTTVVMTVPTTVVLTTTVVITTTVPGPVEVAPEGEVIVPSLNLPSLSVPLLPITPVVTAPG